MLVEFPHAMIPLAPVMVVFIQNETVRGALPAIPTYVVSRYWVVPSRSREVELAKLVAGISVDQAVDVVTLASFLFFEESA